MPKAVALAEAKQLRAEAKAEAEARRVEEKARWAAAKKEAAQRAREVAFSTFLFLRLLLLLLLLFSMAVVAKARSAATPLQTRPLSAAPCSAPSSRVNFALAAGSRGPEAQASTRHVREQAR